MKKSKIIILLLLGFILGALAAIVVYFATRSDLAWREYVENKLIPNAVLALSSVAALCVIALPIMSKIKEIIAMFTKATSDVNDTVESGKRNNERLDEQDRKIESFFERFDKIEKVFTDEMDSLKHTAENTEKILRIGFGNTDELVKKGYAREIAKVGVKDEQRKEKS